MIDAADGYIVSGLGFGDEGKGTIVDFLTRHLAAECVVRYTGGPQAGHNVVSPDGVHHCFSQYGSGMLVPGVRTILTEGMLISPEALANEARVLAGKIGAIGITDGHSPRLTVSARCVVVTPAQRLLNQLQESSRGGARHGSCGMGVGLAVEDRRAGFAVTVGEIVDQPAVALEKMTELYRRRLDQVLELVNRLPPELWSEFDFTRLGVTVRRENNHLVLDGIDIRSLVENYRDILLKHAEIDREGIEVKKVFDRGDYLRRTHGINRPVIFEAAQGALLHPELGFRPFVTKTDPTGRLALEMIPKGARVVRVGVLRSFIHRHGPGPLPIEYPGLSELPQFRDAYNPSNDWQGSFRVSWPDAVMMRYGLEVSGGADMLALTWMDESFVYETVPVCTSYLYIGPLKHLDQYFEWEKLGPARALITRIKPFVGTEQDNRCRTEILSRCEVGDCREFRTWHRSRDTWRRGKLPKAAEEYIGFWEEQLGVPVRIISFGRTAEDKVVR